MSADPVSPRVPDFSVFGGGLAGPLMALYLEQAGKSVNVFELRKDPRPSKDEGGRSINLALSHRGIHALKEVGVLDKVLEAAIPMRGRMMHAVDGTLTFQPYGTEPDHVLYSVSRSGLNRMLLEEAGKRENIHLLFEHKCLWLDLENQTGHFEIQGNQEPAPLPIGSVIGADGAFSKVRAAIRRRERFNYQQDYLTYGYKELTMPPNADGSFKLEKNALHIWPRRSFMMIALPNADGTFTCTLFWPFTGPNSFESLKTEADVKQFFEETFPDAVPLMPDLVQEFMDNPVGPLVTVRCSPYYSGDRAVLIGDACHAVVPFYGQGMNAAFEDCTYLNQALQNGGSIQEAFQAFGDQRHPHANALADLALNNFVEMRDNVGSQGFLLKKGFERVLTRLFPKSFTPLYTMVSFSRIPYADARRKAAEQDRAVVVIGAALLLVLLALLVFLLTR